MKRVTATSPVTAGGYTVQTGGSFPPYVTTYTYDVLSHLTGVSMTRGTTTQTRSFNYTKLNGSIGAELLSATNPENGTVTYTYDTRHRLIGKQDAKGVQQGYSFTYTYEDAFNRLLSVSAGGVTLRTYTYDSNSIDSTYSQSVAGRLATITYPVISYDAQNQLGQGTTTFVDMFSYETYGAIKGKRLRVIKTNPMTLGRTQTATGDLNMSYAHDNEGKVTAVTYPTDAQANITPQYNYQYDAMSRPSGMTDQNTATVVSGVLYGAANELLSMNYDGGTETRSYNAMFQLTGISGLGQNITYNFPAGSNNGKIASQYDAVSGETVSYQYDSLNRLISAAAAGWSQSYSYDGFGNLTNRVGSGAALGNNPTAADPATNRLVNAAYDANGNMLSTGNVYDVENRLMQATMAGGTIQYAYDGQNKRIWQGQFTNSGDPQMLMSDTVSMFGADGQLAATYSPGAAFNNTTNPVAITFGQVVQRVYFGKKLIKWLDGAYAAHNAVQDRSHSVGKYYPYGEERNSPPLANDQLKFATYTRDAATGNDYADQRYYTSAMGRFMTPDPYRATPTSPSDPVNPSTWNRYSYVSGDPVNKFDPRGLRECYMEDDDGNEVDCAVFDKKQKPQTPSVATKAAAYTKYLNTIDDVLKMAKDALDDPDCRALFGDGADPYSVLKDVINGSRSYANFQSVFWEPDKDGLVTYGEVIKLPMLKATLKINMLGWADQANNNNDTFNAETLIHELGHLFSVLGFGSQIKNDSIFNDPQNGPYNDWLVDQKCFGGKLGVPKPGD